MTSSRLFEPLRLGHLELKHRLVLAPLTRFRATIEHVPGPHAQLYYEQRASEPGTLLITEATFISQRAGGYDNVPGIWNDDQVKRWREIVDAVHAKGSFIFLQLWALGRTAGEGNAPEVLARHGYPVVSPSANPINETSKVPVAIPEADIQGWVKEYADATRNAIAAGFDGVEIHGANGYLIDQFWREQINKRTDKYGGNLENRARFGLEVTKAVIEAAGGDSKKVGIRLSPWFTGQGIEAYDATEEFSYIIDQLKTLDLAYLHLVEPRIGGKSAIDAVYTEDTVTRKNDGFVEQWGKQGPLILAGGFDGAKAKHLVEDIYTGENIAVAFGRYWISSPDLPFRIRNNIPLTPYDRSTFYTNDERGYTDYPFSNEYEAHQT